MITRVLFSLTATVLTLGISIPASAQGWSNYTNYGSGVTVNGYDYGNGYGSVRGYNYQTGESAYGTYSPYGSNITTSDGDTIRYNNLTNTGSINGRQFRYNPTTNIYTDDLGNYCNSYGCY